MTTSPEKNSQKLKALVLCAGKGTRLRPLTDSIAKPLVPVANRPILFYVLDHIRRTGIKEIGIVVSPDNEDQIRDAAGKGVRWGVKITYIRQAEAGGLAHAVIAAEKFLGESPFLLFLGDNLIQGDVNAYIQRFMDEPCDAFILLKEVPDPRLFGVAELNSQGQVMRLVEKPKEPRSNLAMVGVYFFTDSVHRATQQIKPSYRGELEITDAIQWLIDQGKIIHSEIVCGWWLDTGKKEDLLNANRIILDENTERLIRGNIDASSTVTGRVEIGEGTEIINSVIKGPVSIGEKCLIKNSAIHPFTSIGTGSVIENVSMEQSIIIGSSRIVDIAQMKDSIIGLNYEVTGRPENKQPVSVFLGSNGKIKL